MSYKEYICISDVIGNQFFIDNNETYFEPCIEISCGNRDEGGILDVAKAKQVIAALQEFVDEHEPQEQPKVAALQNTVGKGGYSKETLYHFSCHTCKKWFSVGDYEPGGSVVKGYCFHCGTFQRFDEVEVK